MPEVDIDQFIHRTIEVINGVECMVWTMDCNEHTANIEEHAPCGGQHRFWAPNVPPNHTHE